MNSSIKSLRLKYRRKALDEGTLYALVEDAASDPGVYEIIKDYLKVESNYSPEDVDYVVDFEISTAKETGTGFNIREALEELHKDPLLRAEAVYNIYFYGRDPYTIKPCWRRWFGPDGFIESYPPSHRPIIENYVRERLQQEGLLPAGE